MLHYRQDDDHGDAVDGGEEVVGDSVGVHVGGLGDEIGGHLGLAEPVDYESDAESVLISLLVLLQRGDYQVLDGLTKRELQSDHF